jgi:hypothetical protein
MSETGEDMASSMTLDQCWALSATWYAGRLELGYQRPPADHFQRLLHGVGLVGDAWALSLPRPA